MAVFVGPRANPYHTVKDRFLCSLPTSYQKVKLSPLLISTTKPRALEHSLVAIDRQTSPGNAKGGFVSQAVDQAFPFYLGSLYVEL